jgi:hypothetical protein
MKLKFAVIFLILPLLFGCNGDNGTEPPESTPLRITSPSNNATLEDPVTVVATAGSGYSFTRVDFYIDGDSVWSDDSAPYQYYWNIFAYSSSSQHTIHAIGHAAEESDTSATVTVNVVIIHGFSFLSAYVPSSFQAFGVVNYQNILFVSTGPDGLEVLDISSKVSPQYLSRYDSPGQAMKADLVYPYVFIADLGGGVTRAIFTDLDSLVYRGIYTTQALANDVAVSDNYLCVAENDGFSIVDFSDPNTLNFINKVSFEDQPQYVVARGDTAFIAALEKFYIIDCTIPTSPQILSAFVTDGLARSVAVIDTFAFIADGPEGVSVFSINDPTNPIEVARFATGQQIFAVAAGDSTLFAGGLAGGVYALDYSVPDTLRLIDQFDSGNSVHELHFDFPYLYVATSRKIDILRFVR